MILMMLDILFQRLKPNILWFHNKKQKYSLVWKIFIVNPHVSDRFTPSRARCAENCGSGRLRVKISKKNCEKMITKIQLLNKFNVDNNVSRITFFLNSCTTRAENEFDYGSWLFLTVVIRLAKLFTFNYIKKEMK